MKPQCPCGGCCYGSPVRCAINVHLQQVRQQSIERRRASLHVVEDPGEDLTSAVQAACEMRSE